MYVNILRLYIILHLLFYMYFEVETFLLEEYINFESFLNLKLYKIISLLL